MVQYALLRLAGFLAARLPRGLLAFLATTAGLAAYPIAGGPRRVVLKNLAVVRPDWSERQRARAAIRVFVHAAMGYVELLLLPQSSREEIGARYPVEGWSILEDAIAQGRGVIIVSAHVGALSIAGNLARLHGIPTTVIVEQLQPPRLHDYVAGLRGALGMEMVAADKTAARRIIAVLRKGELVGMMCDRDVVGTGEPLPFFGHVTRVTTAAATLARRTGAVVVSCVAYRNGLLRGTGAIYGPVEVPHTTNPGEDIRNATLQIISHLELFIHTHPEQWVVFEDLWPCGTIPRTDVNEAVMGSEPT